ncbi:hypothetical protein CLCR_10651 [Cladophialophora carrionii]|uniref:Uncharacterized protein n=1 Tax=Cladophialophora carrionii TaxID=86049 RepID=A0A1C1CZ80_9EURO|nr:hypothetical protein CLCR_10651 [Cladophialophora carrionii]
MCVIYSGTIYLRCSDCNTIDLASARSFRAITQCEADDNHTCPLGLRPLQKCQNISIPDIQRCHECEQVRAEQQRTIHSILRGKHAGRGRGRGRRRVPASARTSRPEAVIRNSPGHNMRLEAFLAGSGVGESSVGNVGNMDVSIPSIFLDATQTQTQTQTLQSTHPAQAEPASDLAVLLSSAEYPPLPELPSDPDFEELFNMDVTFTQSTLRPQQPRVEQAMEGEREVKEEEGQQREEGEEEEAEEQERQEPIDHDHKRDLVDSWLNDVFDVAGCAYPASDEKL